MQELQATTLKSEKQLKQSELKTHVGEWKCSHLYNGIG